MADFTLISKNPALVTLTLVVEASTITNNSGSVITAGSIVDVTQGRKTIRTLDTDTSIEIADGAVATVTPVTGAVGIGMFSRSEAVNGTGAGVIDVTTIATVKKTK